MRGSSRAFAMCLQFSVSRYCTPARAAVATCSASIARRLASSIAGRFRQPPCRRRDSRVIPEYRRSISSRRDAASGSPMPASSITTCEVTTSYSGRCSFIQRLACSWRAATAWIALGHAVAWLTIDFRCRLCPSRHQICSTNAIRSGTGKSRISGGIFDCVIRFGLTGWIRHVRRHNPQV